MDQQTFINSLRQGPPEQIVRRFLNQPAVPAFKSAEEYDLFRAQVRAGFPRASIICIAGSGNWGYSLSPHKGFKQFDGKSDIDTVIVSLEDFIDTWTDFRRFERASWYKLSKTEKVEFAERKDSIYNGFISADWILERGNRTKFDFLIKLNKLSTELVGYRSVHALFFRSFEEAVNYYARGILKARGGR